IKVTDDEDCCLMIGVFRLKKILMRVEYLKKILMNFEYLKSWFSAVDLWSLHILWNWFPLGSFGWISPKQVLVFILLVVVIIIMVVIVVVILVVVIFAIVEVVIVVMNRVLLSDPLTSGICCWLPPKSCRFSKASSKIKFPSNVFESGDNSVCRRSLFNSVQVVRLAGSIHIGWHRQFHNGSKASSTVKFTSTLPWSHTSTIRSPILRVIHKMITYGLCQKTTGYDKIQKNDLWLLSMFDARHQNRYANVAWLIARWMKRRGAGTQKESQICCGQFILKIARKCRVLTKDVVRSLSAPIYCRDLDTTPLRDLIDFEGKLILEDPQPGVPRIGIPRPLRASVQDLYDKMGSLQPTWDDVGDAERTPMWVVPVKPNAPFASVVRRCGGSAATVAMTVEGEGDGMEVTTVVASGGAWW
ncbi:hypothetical protein Tco_1033869, partial [Tanacetum coccineum]